MPEGGPSLRILPAGDAAVLAILAGDVSVATSREVHGLAAVLEEVRPRHAGMGRPVPGHASLLVPFDPLVTDAAAIRRAVRRAARLAGPRQHGPADARPELIVPVRYGGVDGPDLAAVAALCGLGENEVVALHAGVTYDVLLVGFAPGFAYLGLLPERLALPRRASPRTVVPAGSVAIAARQTAVYPLATPGGWHVIGWTDVRPWDPAREEPALFTPGRRVRFVPT